MALPSTPQDDAGAIREHITDIRELAEEMALTAEGVPGMNLTLSKARIARVCRAFLAIQSESERIWKPGDTRVVCAALMDASGRVVTGPRHFDGTMMEQIKRGPDVDAWRGAEQGFVDQKGHFLTREQAHEIAKRQGQIIRRVGSDEMSLFSENLY